MGVVLLAVLVILLLAAGVSAYWSSIGKRHIQSEISDIEIKLEEVALEGILKKKVAELEKAKAKLSETLEEV